MSKIIKKVRLYEDYCTGCGLCSSIEGVEIYQDNRGFPYAKLKDKHISLCDNICPAGGKAYGDYSKEWGQYVSLYEGWSNNTFIRTQASSGGILTALCCYLLDNHLVDGIIQTRASSTIAYKTETVISRTSEDVKSCMGSRYGISSPLSNIKQMVMLNERYVFIGKPCDVASLKAYLAIDQELSSQIIYLFSFFCAGEPSDFAQKRLLSELNCKNEEDCQSLQYRGNGWPGEATAFKKDGSKSSISYDDSWGKILGRDVRKFCRFCIDGIGESADISCGDLWYLDSDNKPDFSEKEGRNIIFARNIKGQELLQKVYESGYIHINETSESDLKFIQKYQYLRRATMVSKLIGLKLFGRQIPKYNWSKMFRLAKYASPVTHVRTMLGILKRTINKKI